MNGTQSKKSNHENDVDFEEFMDIFPTLLEDIKFSIDEKMSLVRIHVEELAHYTVPRGNEIVGLFVPTAYRMLEKPENLTPENLRLSYIMGWIVEFLHKPQNLFNDIIENAETRDGVPAWHTRKDIGLNGINDGLLLDQAGYFLLEKYFGNDDIVQSLYQQLHEISWRITTGDLLGCRFTKLEKLNWPLFTMKNYKNLAKFTSRCYSFWKSVAAAMFLAKISDQDLYNEAENIFIEMGELFHTQDDYLDCFGDVDDTEKHAHTIRKGKCTWLAVKALEEADDEQRKIMEEYYGSADPDAAKIICDLYEELDLPKMYAEYEKEKFDEIKSLLQVASKELPRTLFSTIMAKLEKNAVNGCVH